MAISLGSLGIRTNSRKLLNTAVELAESRLYFQALADGTVEAHSVSKSKKFDSQCLITYWQY